MTTHSGREQLISPDDSVLAGCELENHPIRKSSE
jgi:hypothetical protein